MTASNVTETKGRYWRDGKDRGARWVFYLFVFNYFFGWCSFEGEHYGVDRRILTEWEVGGIGEHDIIFPKNY